MKNLLDKIGIDRIAVLILASLLIIIYSFSGFRKVENLFLDSIVTNFTDPSEASTEIVYAMTTDRSLKEAEKLYQMGWPWRRDTYSKLIKFLNDSKADVIVFDSVFSEKSVYTYAGEPDDSNFAKAMKSAGNVIIGTLFTMTSHELKEAALITTLNLERKYRVRIHGKYKDELIAKYEDQIKTESVKRYKEKFGEGVSKKHQIKYIKQLKKKVENRFVEEKFKELNLDALIEKEVTNKLRKTIGKALKKDFSKVKKIEVINHIISYMQKRYFKKMKKKSDNNPHTQNHAVPIDPNNIIKDNILPIYYNTDPPTRAFWDKKILLGSVVGLIDDDGTARRTSLLIHYFDRYYPALTFATIFHYLKPHKVEILKDKIVLDDLVIPLTKKGYLKLKYYGKSNVYKKIDHADMLKVYDYLNTAYDIYSKSTNKPIVDRDKMVSSSKNIKQFLKQLESQHPDVLKMTFKKLQFPEKLGLSRIYPKFHDKLKYYNDLVDKCPPETFNKKIVLIGDQFAAHFDLRVTPFDKKEVGVHIHATAIDNIISGDILVEFRENIYLIISIFALAVFTYLLIHNRSIITSIVLTFSLLLTVIAFSILAYKYLNYLIDTVTPVLSIVFTVIVITGINYFKESKQKKYIQGAFGQYLSPKVIDIIIDDPEKLNLGGVRKEISAFFSDVQGFSTFSESLSPEDLVHLLNEYLTAMCDIISKYDGVVDKFEGDAIIAFWGAPLDQPDHAKLSCHTSIEMQETLIDMRKAWRDQGRNELLVRIGVNSGPAVVGNLGSSQRMDYTMMGDTVNLAARLEGANKFYTTYTMISDATYQMAKDFVDVRELDTIQVVGKNEPVTVYELLAKKDQTKGSLADTTELYLKALNLYKQMKFAEAISAFQAVLKIIPDDGPAKTYVERCHVFIENPPPADWNGVYRLTSKG